MNLRELLLEKIERTGKGTTAVIGWGRGMGHKGHMYLASSVITHAKEVGGDPYFVVSRTVGKDDPITPEEKLAIYRKVFPDASHIFQTASDELPDLTRVLTNLNQQDYRNVVVIVGADQVDAFQYVKQYNGKPNKAGDIPFNFDNLEVISRQSTKDPSAGEEGPRATPMRQVLLDPSKSEQEQFAVWRDAMSPQISDAEVIDLMNKARQRMQDLKSAPKKVAVKKKIQEPIAQGVAEGERTMSRAAKGYEKYGKAGMQALAKAGRDGVSDGKLDAIRDKHNKYDEDVAEGSDKICMQCGMKGCKCAPGKCKCKPVAGWVPGKGFKSVKEATYKGNIGIMELIKFFNLAKKEPELIKHVKELIADGKDKEVWRIVQKYTGTRLVGPEFNESITESIKQEANRLRHI